MLPGCSHWWHPLGRFVQQALLYPAGRQPHRAVHPVRPNTCREALPATTDSAADFPQVQARCVLAEHLTVLYVSS